MKETIAAIATAPGNSGIGIIRVSGPDAIEITDKLYTDKRTGNKSKSLNDQPANTIHYGFIIDDKKEIVDEVLISIFRAPHSYTAEDVCEINCHGGMLVLRKILRMLFDVGARAAEPGEFTKRAFLNGRIDLSKAEAVMDIISAENNLALKNSESQLSGSIYEKIVALRAEILSDLSYIEAAIDDPEHISLDGFKDRLSDKIANLKKELSALISSYDNGKILKEGIKTAILGRPNAGKSSLLNKLSGSDRAIVTNIAGTTRDVLEQTVLLDGILIHLLDTAGIRDTDNEIESIGVERAKKEALNADLILFVVDSSQDLTSEDKDIFEIVKDKPVIILLNKTDLTMKTGKADAEKFFGSEKYRIVETSMLTEEGISEVSEAIREMFFTGSIRENNEITITNARQFEALKEAEKSLTLTEDGIKNDMAEDFLSIDLTDAYASLGKVIGEEVGEDVINEVFSRFCMGK